MFVEDFQTIVDFVDPHLTLLGLHEILRKEYLTRREITMASTPKEFIFEEAARNKLREGIEKLADIVGVTLGPKGRYVGLESSWGAPKITNDGTHRQRC